MGNKDHTFVLKGSKNAVCEDSIGDGWVHCAKRIIKEIDIRVRVDGSCKTDPSLLSTWNVYTPFSNCCLLAHSEVLQIPFQLANIDGEIKFVLNVLKPECNILFNRPRENKWLLLHISNFSFNLHLTRLLDCLFHQRVQQSCFTRANSPSHD